MAILNGGKISNPSSAPCESCNQLFKDGITDHEIVYRNEGIKNQNDSEVLRNLESEGVLKKITTNDYYIVRDMDHSDPLFLPKVID